MKIMEEIRDGRWKSGSQAAKMYGIKDSLVYKWIDAMGFSHLKSKVMEIKTMEEIDELKLLRKQVKDLKLALAEETLSRQIEQATVQVAATLNSEVSSSTIFMLPVCFPASDRTASFRCFLI